LPPPAFVLLFLLVILIILKYPYRYCRFLNPVFVGFLLGRSDSYPGIPNIAVFAHHERVDSPKGAGRVRRAEKACTTKSRNLTDSPDEFPPEDSQFR